MVNKVLEITFILIIAYLVLSRALGFERVVTSIGKVYNESVKTLQGR